MYKGESPAEPREHAAWLAEWRASCASTNLATLAHVKGERSLAKNLRRGFTWADSLDMDDVEGGQLDYLMNLDSDLLLAANFFERVRADYAVARSACGTPVISGYASARNAKAYVRLTVPTIILSRLNSYRRTILLPRVTVRPSVLPRAGISSST